MALLADSLSGDIVLPCPPFCIVRDLGELLVHGGRFTPVQLRETDCGRLSDVKEVRMGFLKAYLCTIEQ